MKNIKLIFRLLVIALLVLLSSCEKDDTFSNPAEVVSENPNDFSILIEEALQREPVVKSSGPVQTVSFVDIQRYTGRWFEIANFPTTFNLNCSCTTADYAPIEDGPNGLSVFNNCTDTVTGTLTSIAGRAIVVDSSTNAKLQVFLGQIPIPGDYWIIDLVSFTKSEPYDFAVVSGPDRDSLFILSRTPQINTLKQRFALIKILVNLIRQGYDITKIKTSPQFEDCVYPSLD